MNLNARSLKRKSQNREENKYFARVESRENSQNQLCLTKQSSDFGQQIHIGIWGINKPPSQSLAISPEFDSKAAVSDASVRE